MARLERLELADRLVEHLEDDFPGVDDTSHAGRDPARRPAAQAGEVAVQRTSTAAASPSRARRSSSNDVSASDGITVAFVPAGAGFARPTRMLAMIRAGVPCWA